MVAATGPQPPQGCRAAFTDRGERQRALGIWAGGPLGAAARSAFINGMQVALVVGAAVMLAGVLLALLVLSFGRRRSRGCGRASDRADSR